MTAPRPARVLSKLRETHDTWTLEVEDPEPFHPGQFAMLYAFGAGEAPISVSALGEGRAHTVRAVGAVTQALCAVPEGGAIGVRGPFGNAWPLAAAEGRDVVLVAGGLGLAPLRPAIHALLAAPERFGAVTVLYGGRTPSELLFPAELEQWRERIRVDVTVDAPASGWTGKVGLVTKLIERAALDPARTVALICGPEVMMRFAAAALEARGMTDDAVWVSLERSMKCATGHCGHCQLGPLVICRDGPVFRYDRVAPLLRIREL